MTSPVQALKTLTVALALCLGWPATTALAQCADGSPPPCRGARGAPPPTPNSVAVLYFDNLSRDTTDAFLADGLTEEIISRLAQVRRLEVKSRFESLRFRGHAAALDPPTLGRSLNAAYLVTGSVPFKTSASIADRRTSQRKRDPLGSTERIMCPRL